MIQVHVKLMGLLREKSPPDGTVQLDGTPSIERLLERLGIDPASVHVFTVNGSLVRTTDYQLSDGDQLTVLPPVGGGC